MANTNVQDGLGKFPFMKGAGGLVARMIDHDGPASYATNGETILAAALGFKRIAFVIPMGTSDVADFVTAYIGIKKMGTSFVLVWSVRTTGAEVANATNLSGKSCKLLVVGLP